MDALRTPDACFADLTGFDHEPRHLHLAEGLRIGYVHEGPADAPVVVLVHGEPTWGYLYRAMVDQLLGAGLRVVVPDLVGFGRSDKPTAREAYTYAGHVEWLREALFDVLDLPEVFYLGQDWGGLIGLRLLAENPDRFAGTVWSNTGLPTGDVPMPKEWQAFRNMVRSAPVLDIARMVDSGCVRSLTDAERAAYAAPFPSSEYTVGVRVFPELVPNTPDDPAAPANRAAWERLSGLDIPLLCAFSDSDPITRGGDRWLRQKVPGAAGQPHTTITGAGHFVQEDNPVDLAQAVVELVTRTTRE